DLVNQQSDARSFAVIHKCIHLLADLFTSVDLLNCEPTTHRRAFTDNASWSFALAEPTTHRGDWWRNGHTVPSLCPFPGCLFGVERPPRATASGRTRRTPCTTNLRRGNAPSVSVSPADLS